MGGAAHPNWHGESPYTAAGGRAKVMIYVRKFRRDKPWLPNLLQVVVRPDLMAHPCILIADI